MTVKTLSKLYRHFIIDKLITENELYNNYENLITEDKSKLAKEELDAKVEQLIMNEIITDFTTKLHAIEIEMQFLYDIYTTEDTEDNEPNLKMWNIMYDQIKQVFPEFKIKMKGGKE